MSAYYPPIENLQKFNTIVFREAQTSLSAQYLEFPQAQGDETFDNHNLIFSNSGIISQSGTGTNALKATTLSGALTCNSTADFNGAITSQAITQDANYDLTQSGTGIVSQSGTGTNALKATTLSGALTCNSTADFNGAITSQAITQDANYNLTQSGTGIVSQSGTGFNELKNTNITSYVNSPAFYSNPLSSATYTSAVSEITYNSANYGTNILYMSLDIPAYYKDNTITVSTPVSLSQSATVVSTSSPNYTSAGDNQSVDGGTAVSVLCATYTIDKYFTGSVRFQTPISIVGSETFTSVTPPSPTYSRTFVLSAYSFDVYKDAVFFGNYTANLVTNTAGSLTKTQTYTPTLSSTFYLNQFYSDFYCDITPTNQSTSSTYTVYFKATLTRSITVVGCNVSVLLFAIVANTIVSTRLIVGLSPVTATADGTAYTAVSNTNTITPNNWFLQQQITTPTIYVYKDAVLFNSYTPSFTGVIGNYTKTITGSTAGSESSKIFFGNYYFSFIPTYTDTTTVYTIYYNGSVNYTYTFNNRYFTTESKNILINSSSAYNTLTLASYSGSSVSTGFVAGNFNAVFTNSTTGSVISNSQICNDITTNDITTTNITTTKLNTKEIYFKRSSQISSTSSSHYILGNDAASTISCFYFVTDPLNSYIDLTELGADYDGFICYIRTVFGGAIKNYYTGSGVDYYNVTGSSPSPDSRSAENQTFVYFHSPVITGYPTWYMINNV